MVGGSGGPMGVILGAKNDDSEPPVQPGGRVHKKARLEKPVKLSNLEEAADAVRRNTGLDTIEKAAFVDLYAFRMGLSQNEKKAASEMNVQDILDELRELNEVRIGSLGFDLPGDTTY